MTNDRTYGDDLPSTKMRTMRMVHSRRIFHPWWMVRPQSRSLGAVLTLGLMVMTACNASSGTSWTANGSGPSGATQTPTIQNATGGELPATAVATPVATATPVLDAITQLWPTTAFSQITPAAVSGDLSVSGVLNNGTLVAERVSQSGNQPAPDLPAYSMQVGIIDPHTQQFIAMAQVPAGENAGVKTDGRYIVWMTPGAYTGGPGPNMTNIGVIDTATGKSSLILSSPTMIAAPNGAFAVSHGLLIWTQFGALGISDPHVTLQLTNLANLTTTVFAANVPASSSEAALSFAYPYLYYDTTTLSLDLTSGVRVLANLATGQHMDIAALLTNLHANQLHTQVVVTTAGAGPSGGSGPSANLYWSNGNDVSYLSLNNLGGIPSSIPYACANGFDVVDGIIMLYDTAGTRVWDGTHHLSVPVANNGIAVTGSNWIAYPNQQSTSAAHTSYTIVNMTKVAGGS